MDGNGTIFTFSKTGLEKLNPPTKDRLRLSPSLCLPPSLLSHSLSLFIILIGQVLLLCLFVRSERERERDCSFNAQGVRDRLPLWVVSRSPLLHHAYPIKEHNCLFIYNLDIVTLIVKLIFLMF